MKIQRLGLISRIALLVICVEVIAFGLLGWFYINRFSNAIEERTYSHMQLVGRMIASQELQISVISQQSVMSDLVGAPYLNGMVIGGNGRVIVSTSASDLGRVAGDIPGFDARWLSNENADETFFPADNAMTFVMNIRDVEGSAPTYTTLITISIAELNAQKRSIALLGMLGSLLFILLSTAGVVLIAQRLITRRVNLSLNVLKAVENGDVDARIPILSNDEMGQLQRGINSMTVRVGELLNQHRRNEAELQKQKDLLVSIVQHAPIRVFWKDLESRYLGCNSQFAQDAGLSGIEGVVGKTDYDMGWREQAEIYRADDRAVMESGMAKLEFEEPSTIPDGSTVWLSTSKVPLRDKDNRIVGLLGIYTDITSRKEAEQQQHIAAAAFETHEAIMITDDDAKIIRINKAFEKISGYSEKDLVGKDPRILSSGRHDKSFYEEMWKSILSTGSWNGELWDKAKSGHVYPVEMTISAVRDVEGKITNYVAISTDISQRKANEIERQQREDELFQYRQNLEKLVQTRTSELSEALNAAEVANKAKSDFLSSMSHELRTPMNGILGFGQLLFYDNALTDYQKDSVKEILKAGDHLLELINEVLDLSKVESGQIDLSLEPVEVGMMVKECLNMVATLADKRGINIIRTGLKHAAVRADRTRLKQVLLNLLSNAIKYNREGGNVIVEVKAVGEDRLDILVSDTGQGIPANRMRELFQPFNRLSAANSNIEGTGIGLTITRRIIEMMGGKVDVKSEVGVGSTFWIELPIEDVNDYFDVEREEMVFDGDNIKAQIDASHHTVLYIEDNPSNLKLVSQILGQRKHIHLLTAHTPELGIELAMARTPDLILLDINMAGMDGYQVLEVFKAHHNLKNIPVIAVTANAMPREIEHGKMTGFTEYLTKPLDIIRFNGVLDKILNAIPAKQPGAS